jgi:hypothetical protein
MGPFLILDFEAKGVVTVCFGWFSSFLLCATALVYGKTFPLSLGWAGLG